MSVLKVYRNSNGYIIGEIKDKEGIKRMEYSKIPKVLDLLISTGVVDRKIEGKNLRINHTNDAVVIEDYTSLLLSPGINNYNNKVTKILKQKSEQKIKKFQKNKKIERRNKYAKWTVITSSALAITLLASAYLKKQKELKKEDLEITPETNITIEYKEENKKDEKEYTIIEKEQESPQEIIKEEPPQETKKEEIKEVKFINVTTKNIYNIDLELEDRTNDEKYLNTKEKYGELLTKYANEYGIDPNLVLAIATQERGEHSREIDPDGGLGLMQVQYSVWVNHPLRVYNFRLGEYETENITDEKLRDLETNVKIGTMILRHYLEKTNYNLAASVFAYNKGITSVLSILGNGINDPGEVYSWIDAACNLPNGDDFYLWHVGRYMCNKKINIIESDGKEVSFNINNISKVKQLS